MSTSQRGALEGGEVWKVPLEAFTLYAYDNILLGIPDGSTLLHGTESDIAYMSFLFDIAIDTEALPNGVIPESLKKLSAADFVGRAGKTDETAGTVVPKTDETAGTVVMGVNTYGRSRMSCIVSMLSNKFWNNYRMYKYFEVVMGMSDDEIPDEMLKAGFSSRQVKGVERAIAGHKIGGATDASDAVKEAKNWTDGETKWSIVRHSPSHHQFSASHLII